MARAAPAKSVPVEAVPKASNHMSFSTAAEWGRYGRGVLGQQLILRPDFVKAEAARASKGEHVSQNGSQSSTATRFKGLSNADMIHLLLKLDHK